MPDRAIENRTLKSTDLKKKTKKHDVEPKKICLGRDKDRDEID